MERDASARRKRNLLRNWRAAKRDFIMGDYQLIQFTSPEQLAQAAARDWLQAIQAASRRADRYTVAVSGGRIARQFFEATAALAKSGSFPFSNAHFFWADERCVPPTDPESNYKLAYDLMLGPLAVPESQLHRIPGEEEPSRAAELAAADLLSVASKGPEGLPLLDLVLLGMGEDGHVASLFPSEPEAARANPALYRPVVASKPPPHRITLGYNAITAAREAWVLASGPGKEDALRQSLQPDGGTPLARVLKLRRHTKIFSDLRP